MIAAHIESPVRLRLSRAKGYRLQDASRALNGLPAVKVDRSTKWGNPFFQHADGSPMDRKNAVECFRRLLADSGCWWAAMKLDAGAPPEIPPTTVADVRRELVDKNLACWCPRPAEGQPDHCHAAVLLRIAAGGTP